MDLITINEKKHEERLASDRKWHKKQARRAEKRHKNALKQSSRQHWRDLIALCLIVGLIQIIAALITSKATIEASKYRPIVVPVPNLISTGEVPQ